MTPSPELMPCPFCGRRDGTHSPDGCPAYTRPTPTGHISMKRGDLERVRESLKTLAMQKSMQELREYYGDDEYEGDTEYAYDWFVQKSREALSILEAALGDG